MNFLNSHKLYIVAAVLLLLVFGIWYYGPSAGKLTYPSGDITPPPSEAPSPQGVTPVSPSAPVVLPSPPAGRGRIVFSVTDVAPQLELIKSVTLTADRLRINHSTKGWIDVPLNVKSFDLVELKSTRTSGLLANTQLEKGDYTQIRLQVSKVSVLHHDGTSFEAKLPSDEIRFVMRTPIKDREITAVTFDFDLGRSLHTTVDGRYLFAPVVKTLSRNNAAVTITPQNKVQITSGGSSLEISVGMDENGETKDNFTLDPLAEMEILEKAIKIIPQLENENGVSITADRAVEIALGSNKLTRALSVKLMTKGNLKAWRVSGFKGDLRASVDVSTDTGAFID